MSRTTPEQAGRWRHEQVWIGGASLGPHGAQFVPPHDRHVVDAITDLVAFMARDDIPVLVHVALTHAQFETIHPFTDGNGRTGRALMHAMLANKGLTRNVTVPVSAGLLVDPDAYFAALTTYREGRPADIVERLAAASFVAVVNGRELVRRLRDVRAGWSNRIRARRDSGVWRVVDLLMRHPVINASLVAAELSVALPNTYRHIEALERTGIVTEFTDHKRNRAWRATEVLDELDAFAARAGRRARP